MRAVGFAIAVLFLATAAHAYVPPSEFMVKTLAKKRGTMKNARIRSTVSGLAEKLSGARFKQVATFDSATRTIRSRAFDETGKQLLFSLERKLGESAPLADSLVLDTSGAALVHSLNAAKIPVVSEAELLKLQTEEERRAAETTFLGRHGRVVAWVIGKEAPEGSAQPQLWIEKDKFVAVRLVLPNRDAPGGILDIAFANHHFYREIPFPTSITLQPQILREEVTEVAVNADLSAELKAPLGSGPEGKWTDEGRKSPDSVQDLIRQYYTFIR